MGEQDQQDQTTPETPATGEPDKLGEGGVKALQAERQRAKDLEREVARLRPLAEKGEQLEQASKSEVERLTEQLEDARRTGSTATVERDRLRVAIAKGLTPAQAKRLVGTTEEELAADADELLADLGASKPDPVTPPGRPREAMPRGGTDPTGEPAVDDVDKLGERMFRH